MKRFCFCVRRVSGKSEWYNGLMPPDNLNPESVKTIFEVDT